MTKKVRKSGLEFRINNYTLFGQSFPSIAVLNDGKFISTWQSSEQDGSGYGVYAQIFFSNGTKSGSEFQVNNYTDNYQGIPKVEIFSDDSFVIVWTSIEQDGANGGVYSQRSYPNGTKLGSEFQINTYTTKNQNDPRVGIFSDDKFIVIWRSEDQDTSGDGIYAQLFYSNATRLGSEFRANNHTAGDQQASTVKIFSDGKFIIGWQSYEQDGSNYGVYAQIFYLNGTRFGSEFRVNNYTLDSQTNPEIEIFRDDTFVIVWNSDDQDGSYRGVYGQIFYPNGTRLGSEFQIHTYTDNEQRDPTVSIVNEDSFVVVWGSKGQEGLNYGIIGQRFYLNGTKIDFEFQVNTYTTSYQWNPIIKMIAEDVFIVGWESNGQDGSSWGVYAQIFECYTETPSPTATPTPSSTSTKTATPSLSSTSTLTFSGSATSTKTATPSISSTSTLTPSGSVTSTKTATPSISSTPTLTFSGSATSTQTITKSISSTPTLTPSGSATSTQTIMKSISSTSTLTFSRSVTSTKTATPSISSTSTLTPSGSGTSTSTKTPSISSTSTLTPSGSVTPTSSATPSVSSTSTPTPSGSVTPTSSTTPSVSSMPTLTSSISATSTQTTTQSSSLTFTATSSITVIKTATLSASSSPTITSSSAPTKTTIPSCSPTLTSTLSPTTVPTETRTLSITPSPTLTATHTKISPTFSPSFSSSATVSGTYTKISPTFLPSISFSATGSATKTPITYTSEVTNTSFPTLTATPVTLTPIRSRTVSCSFTYSPAISSTATLSETKVPSLTSSSTLTATHTKISPTFSPSFTLSATAMPTKTLITFTPTITNTKSPTVTFTQEKKDPTSYFEITDSIWFMLGVISLGLLLAATCFCAGYRFQYIGADLIDEGPPDDIADDKLEGDPPPNPLVLQSTFTSQEGLMGGMPTPAPCSLEVVSVEDSPTSTADVGTTESVRLEAVSVEEFSAEDNPTVNEGVDTTEPVILEAVLVEDHPMADGAPPHWDSPYSTQIDIDIIGEGEDSV